MSYQTAFQSLVLSQEAKPGEAGEAAAMADGHRSRPETKHSPPPFESTHSPNSKEK